MTVVGSPEVTVADVLAGVPRQLFVGGRWRPSSDGSTFDVFDPAAGQRLAEVADATPGDGRGLVRPGAR